MTSQSRHPESLCLVAWRFASFSMKSHFMEIDRLHFDLARALVDGDLDLLCPRMVLAVFHEPSDVVLEGSGSIRSNERGELWFRMAGPLPATPHRLLRNRGPTVEIPKEEDHVCLHAQDTQGRQWCSSPFVLEPTFPASLVFWVIRGELEHIGWNSTSSLTDKSRLIMHVPHLADLRFGEGTIIQTKVNGQTVLEQWSSDHHRVFIDGAVAEFRKWENSWLQVSVSRQEPLLPSLAGSIAHALEFATCRRARPALIAREWDGNKYVQLQSGPFATEQNYLPPPVNPNSYVELWNMVASFAEYSETMCREDYKSHERVLEELEGIRRGGGGSFATACLTLAVGLEALVELLLSDEIVSRPMADDIRELKKYLKCWTGDEATRERVVGMLAQIESVRASDRLRAWIRRSETRKELLDSWRALRNASAHGRQLQQDELLEHYYRVAELLYRIVASSIKYTGRLLDSSKPGLGVLDS